MGPSPAIAAAARRESCSGLAEGRSAAAANVVRASSMCCCCSTQRGAGPKHGGRYRYGRGHGRHSLLLHRPCLEYSSTGTVSEPYWLFWAVLTSHPCSHLHSPQVFPFRECESSHVTGRLAEPGIPRSITNPPHTAPAGHAPTGGGFSVHSCVLTLFSRFSFGGEDGRAGEEHFVRRAFSAASRAVHASYKPRSPHARQMLHACAPRDERAPCLESVLTASNSKLVLF